MSNTTIQVNLYSGGESKHRNSAPQGFFDDDDFFMGGPRMGNLLKNFGFGQDPFFGNDDMFGGGFGQMQTVMSSNMGNISGGQSKSVSTSTIIKYIFSRPKYINNL